MIEIAYDWHKPIEERFVSFRRSGDDRPGEVVVNIRKAFPYDDDFYDHSPTGFEWGYYGSGPADFALNILYHFTRDRAFSWLYHQEFKIHFLAGAPDRGADIPEAVVVAWIEARQSRAAVVAPEHERLAAFSAQRRARDAGDPDWDLYLVDEELGVELPDYSTIGIPDSALVYVSRSQWERPAASSSRRFHTRETCERLFRSREMIELTVGELAEAGYRMCGKCRAYWEDHVLPRIAEEVA